MYFYVQIISKSFGNNRDRNSIFLSTKKKEADIPEFREDIDPFCFFDDDFGRSGRINTYIESPSIFPIFFMQIWLIILKEFLSYFF